jgi:putative transposase
MEIVRSNKYRLYPNAKQKSMLHEMFGMFRFSFNNTLGKIQDSYFGTYEVKNGKNKGNIVPAIPSQTEIIGFSTKLKQEYNFMNRLPNDYIQASLTNLFKATKGFYRGGGFPKFKSRKDNKQCINMYAGSRVKIEDEHIILSKAKNTPYCKEDHKIKFKKHKTNHDIGKVTGFTIEKDNLGLYWISITYKIQIQDLKITKGKEVGIDLGIKELVSCSDGLVIKNHNLTKKNARKLKLEQRKLSRKKKGSKNRNKQRKKVGKIHKKISNSRKDYNHKVSKKLIDLYDLVVLEDLQVKNMIKNRRLSKAIANAAWFQLITYIEYKANENQVSFIKIDKWYPSSKTCSNCGSVKEYLGLEERVYVCNECGFSIDRDINASINILNEGKRLARKE